MSKREKQDEIYVLSEWGCLSSVLKDYGIDINHITGTVGTHMVNDFMDMMEKAGYVRKGDAEDDGK